MKLNVSKKWCEARFVKESDSDITVGVPQESEGAQANLPSGATPEEEEFRHFHAFGGLIQFLRRDRKLSVEDLATKARVDLGEIVAIEKDPSFVPKPRTVHQLATFFKVSERGLLKLSNVTTVHNRKFRDAALLFAANSSTMMELTREERVALTDFVEFLSKDD